MSIYPQRSYEHLRPRVMLSWGRRLVSCQGSCGAQVLRHPVLAICSGGDENYVPVPRSRDCILLLLLCFALWACRTHFLSLSVHVCSSLQWRKSITCILVRIPLRDAHYRWSQAGQKTPSEKLTTSSCMVSESQHWRAKSASPPPTKPGLAGLDPHAGLRFYLLLT